ncbi:DUF7007 domain-containing protein [Sphingomonas silueang]|uniref:DUF7007 domain-containing protein n=1 Tax=Sphingomonas silueang TaxID=3156617 RepID=UPI0032B5AF86
MTLFASSPRPDHSPWGPLQTADQRLPGIWHVTTASHGGFLLSDERQSAMPALLRRDDAASEEDVDWTRVMLAFEPEWRATRDPLRDLELPLAHDIARNWLPDAYGAFTGKAVTPRDSNVSRRRAAYQAVIGGYVSTAAYGDWADWVPTGKVGVVFRQLAGVDALGFANYTGEVRYGLVDKARYAERTEVETFESLGAVQVESMAPITKQVAALA